MVVVTQCAQQHALAFIEQFAVGLDLDAVESATENSLHDTPAVGILVASAAQFVCGRCHNGVKTEIADVDRVVVISDLEYIDLMGGSLYKVSDAAESNI